METKPEGYVDPRTGVAVAGTRTWKEHPNNPGATQRIPDNKVAEARSVAAHHYLMEPAE
jgi:hypothetical protein